jgi:hypothetical protein
MIWEGRVEGNSRLDFKQATTLPAVVATAAITLFDVFGLPLPQLLTTIPLLPLTRPPTHL